MNLDHDKSELLFFFLNKLTYNWKNLQSPIEQVSLSYIIIKQFGNVISCIPSSFVKLQLDADS